MSTKNIKDTLRENQISVKKRFGQNFLLDKNILSKIIDVSNIDEETLVVEIGPGLGSLTEGLIKKAKHVLAYEIDHQLIPVLQKAFKGENLTLIHDDILKRNIDQDIEALNLNYQAVVVVANLPYYITTPILMKCLEESKLIQKMVVMMQYEVAKRITALTETKDYNALSVGIQYRAKTKLAFKVPRSVFMPPPNVDSAVVTLDFYEEPPVAIDSENVFFQLVKSAFKQRRKTILNNLSVEYQIDKERLIKHLETCDIFPQRRAETLSLLEFATLANYFYKLDDVKK